MSSTAHPEPVDPAAGRSSDHTDAAATDDGQPSPGPAGAAPTDPRRRRRLVASTVVLAAVVLVLDQLTKWWAESTLELGADPVPLVGSLLGLRLLYNPGAALSIATGVTWLLTIVVVVVVVVIVRMVGRIGSRAWAVALGLLLGGALGNLGDRFFREPGFARGHVVDFIDYAGFFVGNVADIAIVAAAVMIAVLSVLGIGLDGTRHTDDPAADRDGSADAAAAVPSGDTADDASGDVGRSGASGDGRAAGDGR